MRLLTRRFGQVNAAWPGGQAKLEDDQDGHFFFNHPERGGNSAACSHCYCCLDPIPPTEGGGLEDGNDYSSTYSTVAQGNRFNLDVDGSDSIEREREIISKDAWVDLIRIRVA